MRRYFCFNLIISDAVTAHLKEKALKKKLKYLAAILSCVITQTSFSAEEKILNVYTWSGVIPDVVIQQFEKETGIKVNFSTYDSNEVMYAKLKTSKNAGYDVIEPSSYYVDRMRRQGMLEKLDKARLPNFRNLNPDFLNQSYDPQNQFSQPFIWGITGIFTNKTQIPPGSVNRWSDLWENQYHDKLMLLDDTREVFSMGLKVLGYSVNDNNPAHIKEAYLKLKELLPNIKLFSNAVLSIAIDEDAGIGMAWNGDLYKAHLENPHLNFVYPKDGFVIWVDNFAIPKGVLHRDNAYLFLNYMLREDVARKVALDNHFPTPNLAAWKSLPVEIKNNPTAYPPRKVLRRGEFQTDIGDEALMLYEKYWEQLKMGG
jgi:spermidine/putrescine transport system substrate-binding protein